MQRLRRFFRFIGVRDVERAVDDELRFHLDMRVDELMRDGATRQRAEAQARGEFGSVTEARSELAAIDRRTAMRTERVEWWSDLLLDARIAIRGYMRQPGFTAVVLVTLALGIGANTAIFSVVNSVLLRPLPYREADRLVHLWETHRGDVSNRSEASYPDFGDWREQRDVFSALEAYDGTNVTVSTASGGEMISGIRVTSGFFRMLGVTPATGRTFDAADDVSGGTKAVVLSHGFVQRHLGGDRSIVGRTLIINGVAHEVRGILPRGFGFGSGETDLWLPLDRNDTVRAQRFNHWLNVVGRLREGVTIDAARQRMTTLMRRLAEQYPESNDGRGALVIPLRDVVLANTERPLLVLFGAVALVLLIACANVASLVLARAIERTREIAVRGAIGASRGRVVRQLLAENLVLAGAGAVLGVIVASVGVRLLVAAIPPNMLSSAAAEVIHINATALLFTLGVAIGTGLLFALVPALLASRQSSAQLLRSDSRAGASRARHRARDLLVATEVALTFVLLVGAALMGRSVLALLRVDPGFNGESVVTARVALAGPKYADQRVQPPFFDELLARVRAIPGVEQVGAISSAPLQGGGTNTFHVEGEPEPTPADRPEATTRAVAGDYFRSLRIPLIDGRLLNDRDDLRSYYAVVVSETLAHRLFGSRPAVGRRIRFYAWEDSAWTIVGVVGDVKTDALDAPSAPTVYYNHRQGPANRMSLMVRTTVDRPESLIPQLRKAVAELDPAVAVYGTMTMLDRTASTQAVYFRRYLLKLLAIFAVAALLLSIIGVYGVIAYSVTQRMREIAIRIALGAKDAQVVRLILRDGVSIVIAGIVVGSLAALALSRAMTSLLFGVSAADLSTYLLAGTLLLAIGFIASWIPARHATRFDPAVTLRSE